MVLSIVRSMDWKKRIGGRIREARDESGLTLEEVSKRTSGVLKPSRLNNYEKGIRLLKPKEASVLAGVYKKDVAWLMCLEGDDMTDQERDLLTNWRVLPENYRNDYARRIAALALVYREPAPDERVKSTASPVPARSPARKRAKN